MKMASSSSHNSGIPLTTLLEWYKIRDTMFGASAIPQDIPLALEMASACQHPDACWLTDVCAGKDVNTAEDAKRVFSALGQNDARALCFMWLCRDWIEQEDISPLRRSADLGFAFAQVSLANRIFDEDRFSLAELAAAQGERDGLYLVGSCFRDGTGCEKDLDKAKENFLLGTWSRLGDWSARFFS
jgi:TPR repeat protein